MIFCNFPDTLLENSMFRLFLSVVSPNLNILSRDAYEYSYLPKIKILAENEITENLTKSKYITIICDGLTDNSNQSMVYFVAVNERREKIPLNITVPKGARDADFYCKLFSDCISKIPGGTVVTSIATDGEPAVSAGRDMFCCTKSIMSIRCTIHMLNLLVKDFFKPQYRESLNIVFKRSLKLVSYFHQSSKFYEDISTVNINYKRIKTLSNTRFIYFIDVLNSILNLEYELCYYVNNLKCEWDKSIKAIIKDKDFWMSLKCTVTVLAPFNAIGGYLQGTSVKCSDIVFFLIKVYYYIEKAEIEDKTKSFLSSMIINRFNEMLSIEHCLFILIYFLDVRYKGLLLSNMWKQIASNALKHFCWRIGVEEDIAVGINSLFLSFIECHTINVDPNIFWMTYSESNIFESGLKYFSNYCFNIVPHSCDIERMFSIERIFRNRTRNSLKSSRSLNNFEMLFYIKKKYYCQLKDKGFIKEKSMENRSDTEMYSKKRNIEQSILEEEQYFKTTEMEPEDAYKIIEELIETPDKMYKELKPPKNIYKEKTRVGDFEINISTYLGKTPLVIPERMEILSNEIKEQLSSIIDIRIGNDRNRILTFKEPCSWDK